MKISLKYYSFSTFLVNELGFETHSFTACRLKGLRNISVSNQTESVDIMLIEWADCMVPQQALEWRRTRNITDF